jgi:hypothetical protein
MTLTLERTSAWQEPKPWHIAEWGIVMRMARRASGLALEYARKSGSITDPLESNILLYTDDPTAAWLMVANSDMAAICGTSGIEGVYCRMDFPPSAFECTRSWVADELNNARQAENSQWAVEDLPRVAAMCFPPTGTKCPRCRNYTAPEGKELCDRCTDISGR